MNLAQMLPNLREIDHSGFDERRQAYKRIVLRRDITIERVAKRSSNAETEGEPRDHESEVEFNEIEVEHVTYAVAKPKPRFVSACRHI